jgi:hypothetical protein
MNILSHPILVVLAVCAAGAFLIAFKPQRHPALLLPLLILLLFALPRAGLSVQSIRLPLPLAHGLCALLILEWLILRPARHLEPHARFGRYFLAYAAIAGFALAMGLSQDNMPAITFIELCLYLFSMGLFFYTSDTFSRREDFLRCIRWLLATAVCVSLYGLAQLRWGAAILIPNITYTTGGSTLSRTYVETGELETTRVLSSYGDPNVLASQLLVFAAIGLAILLPKRLPVAWRFTGLVVLALSSACIWATGSRAAIIGMALAVAVIILWHNRWFVLLIPTLAALVILALGLTWLDSLNAWYDQLASSNDVRFQFPRMLWELTQAVPLGCGFGRTLVFNDPATSWSYSIVPTGVVWGGFNSFWLNLYCRIGLPGVLAFSGVLAVIFHFIWTRSRHADHPLAQAALVGLAAGFVGQWFIWLANNTYMLPGGGLNFWFLYGIAVAGARAFAPELRPVPLVAPAANFPFPAAAATPMPPR